MGTGLIDMQVQSFFYYFIYKKNGEKRNVANSICWQGLRDEMLKVPEELFMNSGFSELLYPRSKMRSQALIQTSTSEASKSL